VNMAHEAKPHLPGAVLMLLAVAAAMRYVETGRRRWWLATALLCGAAFGMVLSALPIFVVLPVMMLLRRQSWPEWLSKTALGLLCGLAVYLVANPYIVINLFSNRQVLSSNFGNSLAMYEITRLGEGAIHAAWLVAEGTSPLLAGAGVVGAAVYAIRASRRRRGGEAPLGWLLAAPVLLIAMQFVALAAGKPGEYGRFAVLPDIALAMAAAVAIRRYVSQVPLRLVLLAGLLGGASFSGYAYLAGFVRDSARETSRMQAAGVLQKYCDHGARALGIQAEPAPYTLPPVNLFRWRILLLPENHSPKALVRPDVLIRPRGTRPFAVESAAGGNDTAATVGSQWDATPHWDATPISWADKTFELFVSTQPTSATRSHED